MKNLDITIKCKIEIVWFQFGKGRVKKVKPLRDKISILIIRYNKHMISRDTVQQNLVNCLIGSDFALLGVKRVGKVRDCYTKQNKRIIVVTDRVSAFDHTFKEAIPFKGQVLNQISAYFMEAAGTIVPTHIISLPDPNITVAKECVPYPVEIIVRGYLTGHAWRVYKEGKRKLCGVVLPDGMKMNQKFEKPIITPTTKPDEGHDEDISRQEIIERGLVPKLVYEKIEEKALELFKQGSEMAAKRGLILVDTKYEFGDYNGELTLIDEVHTPDSSRFFYADSYKENFEKEYKQKQLSKEFLREWLMDKNFQGEEFQSVPALDDEIRIDVAMRYIELYEIITGREFVAEIGKPIEKRIEENIQQYY